MKMQYDNSFNNLFNKIIWQGKIGGVRCIYGEYKHFIPRCNMVLVVGSEILPIVKEQEQDVLKLLTRGNKDEVRTIN